MSLAFMEAFAEMKIDNEASNQTFKRNLEKKTISWLIKQKPKINSARISSFFKPKEERNQASLQKITTYSTEQVDENNEPHKFETEKSINLLPEIQKDSDESKKDPKQNDRKSNSDE